MLYYSSTCLAWGFGCAEDSDGGWRYLIMIGRSARCGGQSQCSWNRHVTVPMFLQLKKQRRIQCETCCWCLARGFWWHLRQNMVCKRQRRGAGARFASLSAYLFYKVSNLTSLYSRKDPGLNRTKSLEKAFLKGSNTTCQMHIWQHYVYYSRCCKEAGIEEAEHCIPPEILHACDSKSKKLTQTKLKMLGDRESAPRQFS